MSQKKQIDEIFMIIADVACGNIPEDECDVKDSCSHCRAERLYNAGYRKQSEGEWRPYKTPLDARQTGWICSKCSSVIYDLSNGDTDFCPYCGAKMKGGE